MFNYEDTILTSGTEKSTKGTDISSETAEYSVTRPEEGVDNESEVRHVTI